MEPNPTLKTFLKPYSPDIQKLTISLRNYITDLVPEANELIWDNYNVVAIAYSKSDKLKDAFCHIAVYSKYVNFGFNRGAELPKTAIKLKGSGKLIRHITVKEFSKFPIEDVETLIWKAVAISEKLNPTLLEKQASPESLIMSISEKKARPNSDSGG